MKKIVAVIAMVYCVYAVFPGSCDVVRQGISYKIENGTSARVHGTCDLNSTAWLQEGGRLVIPPFVGEVKVGAIDSYAFKGVQSIRSVVLPETITFIGKEAFCACSNLESVVMNEYGDDFLLKHPMRKSIGGQAFAYNEKLKSVALPKTLESLGPGVFDGCLALSNVSLPLGLWHIDELAFASCRAIDKVAIPASVEKMDDAFGYDTPNLAEIVVDQDNPWYRSEGPAVYSLTNRALIFYSRVCKNDFVYVKHGTRTIQNYSFMNCKGIGRVELPNSVESIGMGAFACSSLRSISLPETLKVIGSGAFAECDALESISIPGGVSSMGERVFWGCDSLAEIELECPPPPISADKEFPSNAVFKVLGYVEEWRQYGLATGRTIRPKKSVRQGCGRVSPL